MMEELAHQKEVIKLGEAIIDEFEKSEYADTLSRWMAYHVAEIVTQLKSSPSPETQRECFELILELWKHRSSLKRGLRPLEDFEPVWRALASLDPDSQTPRYFSHFPRVGLEELPLTEKLSGLLVHVDETAKTVCEFILQQISEIARSDKLRKYLTLELPEISGPDLDLARRLFGYTSEGERFTVKRYNVQNLRGKISKLDNFVEIARGVLADLQETLNSLEAEAEAEAEATEGQS